MTKEEIGKIVAKQRKYFLTGRTLDVDFRIRMLKALRAGLKKYEPRLNAAIKADLGKSNFETYMCETGLCLSEITYMLGHIRSFAAEKTVMTPLAQFHSRSFMKPSPYGVTLIMSPWNYPLLLTIDPLIDAIAAGNTAVVKPSAYSPETSAVMMEMLQEYFSESYIAVVTGGRAENSALLEEHFDYIFFTGSKTVGRYVMEKAAPHLTPVTLELGGKSPCIIDRTANLRLAAKRLVFGKYLNCGQTCVAPDYVLVEESVKDALISEVKQQIVRQYGQHPLENPDYGKIINEKHFERILGLIDQEKVVAGGQYDRDRLQIAPTVMDHVTFDDPVMQEEIFGPVMPILTFKNLHEVIDRVNSMDHPLALYIFTSSKKTGEWVLSRTGFGGGCINDTIIHLATSEMPFGGFGESGMGGYHGKKGFETFSHYKSIVDKKTWIDLPMRYQKYQLVNDLLIHMFLR